MPVTNPAPGRRSLLGAAWLAGAWVVPAVAGADGGFHTSPACWEAPRIHHVGAPEPQLRERVTIGPGPTERPPGTGETSPNGAYRFWVEAPDTSVPGPWRASVRIDHERPQLLELGLEDVAGTVHPRWVNEKLLFVRVPWGRLQMSDLVLDVESGEIVHHEVAVSGELAFAQFQAACDGACPCPDPAAPAPVPTEIPDGAAIPGRVLGLVALDRLLEPEATLVARAAPDPDGTPLATLASPADLETREYGYEKPGAVVYARSGRWLQVRLAPGGEPAWIGGDVALPFLPLETLLPNRLNYLTAGWDRQLRDAPGRDRPPRPVRAAPGRETPARVLDSRRQDGVLWLHVEVMDRSPCHGSGAPEAIAEGWIPAHDERGQTTAWFHARGC